MEPKTLYNILNFIEQKDRKVVPDKFYFKYYKQLKDIFPENIKEKVKQKIVEDNQKIQQYIFKNGSVGDLDLRGTLIEKLPYNLTKVDGYFNLHKSKIQSLNNLESVDQNIWLGYSQIQDLGKLEYVGGNLYLRNT